MMFGEHQSESPRVPSPWANTRRGSSSRQSSGNSSRINAADHINNPSIPFNKSGSTSSPNFSPLSRAVQVRNAEAYRDSINRKAYNTQHECEDEPTPPTEDDDYGFCEGLDSFFALDSDVDIQRLSSSQQSSSSDILTPLDGVELLSTASHSNRILSTNRRNKKKRIARLAPEPDVLGNLEYKLRIIPPTRHRYDKLLTQMQWRALQGGGECTYEIGVLDDGLCIGICPMEMQASLSILSVMAKELNATVLIRKAFEVIPMDETVQNGGGEVKSLTNEQVFDLFGNHSTATCDCGMNFKSVHEAVQYLPHLGKHRTRIQSQVDSNDEVCPGEVIIAIEKDIGDMFTYEHNGKNDESDSYSDDEESPLEDHGEGFFLEDDRETTFSLSLDERATRAGLGFQRKAKTARRRCRYNVESAMANRPKGKVAMTNITHASVNSSPTPRVIVENVDLIKQENVVGTIVESLASASINPSTHTNTVQNGLTLQDSREPIQALPEETSMKCIRTIVEATIIRDADEDAFIDYGSL